MQQYNTLGDRYELLKQIGGGGMANVFLAREKTLNRQVAIKVIRSELLSDDTNLERFKTEARIVAQLDHPSIVKIFNFNADQFGVYVVMPFLQGGSLEQRIQQAQSLPSIVEVGDFVLKVGSALHHVHEQGITHRDIKLSNIMFDAIGTPIVVDFGIAKLADGANLTRTHMPIGTPRFMAPEQWTGKNVGPASDQYSLAILIFILLTGVPIFDADSSATYMHLHLNQQPPSAHENNPAVPVELSNVLLRALAKSPEERYDSILEFVRAVQAISSQVNGEGTGFFTFPVQLQMHDLPDTTPSWAGVPVPTNPWVHTDRVTGSQYTKPVSRTSDNEAREVRQNINRRFAMLVFSGIMTLAIFAAFFLVANIQDQAIPVTNQPGEVVSIEQTPLALIAVPTMTSTPDATATQVGVTEQPAVAAVNNVTPTADGANQVDEIATRVDGTVNAQESATAQFGIISTQAAETVIANMRATEQMNQTAAARDAVAATEIAVTNMMTTEEQQTEIAALTVVQQSTQNAIDEAATSQWLSQNALNQAATAQQLTQNSNQTATAQTREEETTREPESCPGLVTSRLIIGEQGRVIVDGSGGNRLRQSASTNASIILTIPEGAIFEILDGPACVQGYAWWRVRYGNNVGWTAEGDDVDYYLEALDERTGTGSTRNLLDGGRGQTNNTRVDNGQFQVEYYCQRYGYGSQTRNDNENWYCYRGGERVMTLSQHDFTQICRDTYDDQEAYAMQNGRNSVPAFRWLCYGD